MTKTIFTNSYLNLAGVIGLSTAVALSTNPAFAKKNKKALMNVGEAIALFQKDCLAKVGNTQANKKALRKSGFTVVKDEKATTTLVHPTKRANATVIGGDLLYSCEVSYQVKDGKLFSKNKRSAEKEATLALILIKVKAAPKAKVSNIKGAGRAFFKKNGYIYTIQNKSNSAVSMSVSKFVN